MTSEFARHLRYGQQGERIVALWLGKQGYFVTPTASIVDPRNRAPSLVNEFSGGRKVLPDFMASLSGCSRWIEVKTKSKDVLYQIAGEHRQGIEARLFEDYLYVERESGIPGYLAFLVAEPKPVKLRIGSLRLLYQHRRQQQRKPGEGSGPLMVYWPIDIFETHEIVDDELVRMHPGKQEAGVSYPWERPAPKVSEQQEYFDFTAAAPRYRTD